MDFYDGTKIRTTKDLDGEIPFFCLTVGNRNTGKTTNYHKFLFDEFLSQGRQFLLLTRYGNEIKGCALNYFSSIQDLFFQDYYVNIENICDGLFKALHFYHGEEDLGIGGYVVSLSGSDKVKKFSSIFYKVYNSFMDEFQSEDNSYLDDEVSHLQSIIQSVYRRRAGRCFLASNAISILSPIFSAFGIDKRLKPDTKILRGKGWVLEVNYNEAAATYTQTSSWGKAFANTTYSQYSSSVDFMDNKSFVTINNETYQHMFTILYNRKYYGVEYITNSALFYINENGNKDDSLVIATNINEHNENTLMSSNAIIRNKMRDAFNSGLVRFKTLNCKDAFLELVKYRS